MSIEQPKKSDAVKVGWKSSMDRAADELESQKERRKRLIEMVKDLFPLPEQMLLRREIGRSFNVPQFGDHHNEGMLMDTHFEAILHALDDIENGVFPDGIPDEDKKYMQEIAIKHHEALRKYVFLHDIDKAPDLAFDTLPKDGEKKGERWEGTLDQWYEEQQIPEDARTNPVLLHALLVERGIKGFGYYHQGIDMPKFNRRTVASSHGEDGKKTLIRFEQNGVPSGVSPAFLDAIERHEVAYQFEKVSVATYRKYFDSLSPEDRGIALIASLTDTLGSWKKGGNPDISNFLKLLESKKIAEANTPIILNLEQVYAEIKSSAGLDEEKVKVFFATLRKKSELINENFDVLRDRFLKECKAKIMASYDTDVLRTKLLELVIQTTITEEEMKFILEKVESKATGEIGKRMGKKFKLISEKLKESEVK